jgi:DnaJ-class molecular chaperone
MSAIPTMDGDRAGSEQLRKVSAREPLPFSEPLACEECAGEGEIPIISTRPYGKVKIVDIVMQPCPVCGGTGDANGLV